MYQQSLVYMHLPRVFYSYKTPYLSGIHKIGCLGLASNVRVPLHKNNHERLENNH